MLKMVASDLDGTLLQNGAQSLTERAKKQIHCLQGHGIIFVAASGRQYPNLIRLFGELAKDMAFICENGAYTICQGREVSQVSMDRSLGIEILKEIDRTDGCEILLSGKQTSYLQPKTEEYVYRMKSIVKNNVTIVEDITKVEEPFLKISVYCKEGIEKVAKHFTECFGSRAKATISGKLWLDFTDKKVNKGAALLALQKELGVLLEETMVFGDNYNDLELFGCAKESYVMESAVPEVKAYANYEADSVENVLDRFIQQYYI